MIELFNFLFENIIFTWLGGAIFIVLGVFKFRKVLSKMSWDSDWLSYEIFGDGLAFSIGLLALGVVIIIQKIKVL